MPRQYLDQDEVELFGAVGIFFLIDGFLAQVQQGAAAGQHQQNSGHGHQQGQNPARPFRGRMAENG